MLKFLLSFLFLLFFFISPIKVNAAGEFSSSYDVLYSINQTGETVVSEKITLKNLTDRYFASNFSLTISASKLTDVTAFDDQGPLNVAVQNVDKKTKIDVKFNQQIVGYDKEYKWNLSFKSKDFTEKQGKIWQVSIPKVSSLNEEDKYNLTLAVPVEFNDPSSIFPEPLSQSESGGSIQLKFDKAQVVNSGILANFGTNQLFNFKLRYNFENPGLLPAIGKIPLPSNNEFQQVSIDKVSPKPENVTVDSDGNYIGWFKVDGKKDLEVLVEGVANLYVNKIFQSKSLTEEEKSTYTQSQTFWEKDNPQVKNALSEIFKDGTPKKNADKAKLINKYVVASLKYSDQRLKNNNFDRLGAATALTNPTEALCSEFTDLFIALSRASGIPARQKLGYAFTANNELRPLSLKDDILHTWPEYYDSELGWVMIDPTWENTTGGVNYFSKFDLNHFTLATRGYSSKEPITADDVIVKFADGEFTPAEKLNLIIDSKDQIISGFPSKAIIRVINSGNFTSPRKSLLFTTTKLKISDKNTFDLPEIPPFGEFEYEFKLSTKDLLDSYEDTLGLHVGKESVDKKVLVKPFFAYKYFSVGLVVVTLSMISIYILMLFLYFKKRPILKPKI